MVDILETKTRITADNDRQAEAVRKMTKEHHTFFINLMGSPGAGKTSVLARLIEGLKEEFRIGVMEADVDSKVDAETVARTGAKVVQLHTGGSCHMDADMTIRGLEAMGLEGLDLVVLENVGNLVCPAEFDVGADLKMMILSAPEGDDKPLKYPLMFQVSDVMILNKIDVRDVFDFDPDRAVERARRLNPDIRPFPVSAKTGEGFAELVDFLKERIREKTV